MSIDNAITYVDAGFFLLRTPLVALDWFSSWSEGAQLSSVDLEAAAADEALAADRLLLRARLGALLDRPEVQEAVFVSSPDLFGSLSFWREKPDSERGLKVERALVRYASRMASRPTPFGLFAGVTLGRTGDATRIELAAPSAHRRHTRLDMNYLGELTSELAQDAELAQQLRYRPNDSLYRVGDQYRYVESDRQGPRRSYRRTAIFHDAHVDAALACAASGATLTELGDRLFSIDPEVDREEVDGYVQELVRSQVLVPELRPTITGPEPISGVIELLSHHPAGQAAAAVLRRVDASIAELDRAGLCPQLARYEAIVKDLESLPAKIEPARLFQVDLEAGVSTVELDRRLVDGVVRDLELLVDCGTRSDALGRFATRFRTRYEDRTVPLVEVLDEEFGIGLTEPGLTEDDASPLLEGIALPPRSEPRRVLIEAWDLLLMRKLERFWKTGGEEIVLDEAEVRPLAPKAKAFRPPTLGVGLTFIKGPGEQGVARAVVSQSGIQILGRFCHVAPEINDAVMGYLRAQEAHQPDALFAEVVHLPEERIGNVLLRPVLRGHEIPFLGASGAPVEQQIALTDLMVSLRGDEVVLHSQRLGRRIIPTLLSAHNHSAPGNLALYQFLCRLQQQDQVHLGLGWGPRFDDVRYLPRLVLGRLVLARARWLVDHEALKTLHGKAGAALVGALRALRAEYALPRHVLLEDGDNVLPIDFHNLLSVESFAALVKRRSQVILRELYPDGDQLVRGPEGGHTHEILLPLLRPLPQKDATSIARPPAAPKVRRASRHTVGDEWLYLKLYCGRATADQVLREVVAPLVADGRAGGLADRWFFIRYGDPDAHLRLRFHGDPGVLVQSLLPRVRRVVEPFLESGQIWRLQLDTYDREEERYGGPAGMTLSEQVFCHDSEAVLSIVESITDEALPDARWQLALKGCHQLLVDLGFSIEERKRVTARLSASYRREMRLENGFEHQLGTRFRRERPRLDALVGAATRKPEAAPLDWPEAHAALAQRAAQLGPVVAALRAEPSLTVSLDDLAGSYLHMHCNRLLRGAARAQEALLYEFLDRLYESELARAKKARR